MKALNSVFLAHPAEVNENYPQHLSSALAFSRDLVLASLVCGIHAFFPCLFTRTASGIVDRLHDRMVVNRARVPNRARRPNRARPRS